VRHRRRWKWSQIGALLVFLLPGLIWFWGFSLYPLAHGFWMSLTDWKLIGASTFVGLKNYLQLLGDPIILTALRNNAIYAVLSVPAQMVLGLIVAILIDSQKRGKGIFRAIYYLPVISSWVVVSLIFQYLFGNRGVANYFLQVSHLSSSPIPWLAQPFTALIIIALLGTWKGLGWAMLIYSAALQTVSEELKEAARIDGATEMQVVRWITVPLLTPTTLFILVLLTIGAFQAFIQFYIITGGGPLDETQVFLTYMYQQAFQYLDFSYAAAISFALALLVFILSLFQIRLLRFRYD
jgi:multiple sugar transport system permease protein